MRKVCDPSVGQAEYEECLERRRRRRAKQQDDDGRFARLAEIEDEEDADEDD